MLKTKLLHPDLLAALGRAGHGSKILIADGNYPFATARSPQAELVPLNLMPGVVSCTQVLEAVVATVPIEEAAVMQPQREGPHAMKENPPIWEEFRKQLQAVDGPAQLEPLERFDFYKAASDPNCALTIATAEQRIFANLLLTIGVVKPE